MAGDTYCEGDAQNRQCNGQRVLDCGFQPDWIKTKDHTIGICCFSAKPAALKRKNTELG